ncbi:MAG TPA: histidinol-phosphatase HisJ [Candidatus Levilactobacillus faecigallinarum]|uniref:Histidinol-phosphatase n=1 Tax=Candidatus Levilactobacillus faecigallinarum TaxID=2838638 RepID=A0A9D1QSN5_9LACO|nr:histidinol-phosphatase HisJ [Candidatus Levilactobacillus faecigallinarum]
MLSLAELHQIKRQTWSGHNHTEFCPHGSGEDTEAFIQRAIASGFQTYSITEHFPLPPEFYRPTTGSRHAIATAAMRLTELPAYFTKMAMLKRKYHNQIRLLVGFEVDYIAEFREWTVQQLARYHNQMDDAILSVHFLPTETGLRAIDESPQDFRQGVLQAYGSPVAVANAYLQTLQAAVDWSTPNKPHRYGHPMLYRKWRNTFPSQTLWADATTQERQHTLYASIQRRQEFLDCNMAGLFRPTETESSPNQDWLRAAQQAQIPLVFGADAHKVAAVDQGYNTYLENHYFM